MAVWFTGGTNGQAGITGRAGSKPRVHASAQDWGNVPNITDFWFTPHTDIIVASTPDLLAANHGWISNGTLSYVAGSGADFGSSADYGTPAHLLFNSPGERLTSPFVFGSWTRMNHIRRTLGWQPNQLIMESYAVWTTASNADTTGGIGFVEAGGSIQTANDALAMVTSDGTNWILRSGAATSSFALAVDTNPHLWTIIIDKGTQLVTFMQDLVPVGTGGSSGTGVVALETDLFPAAFGAAVTSSNVIGLGDTHTYYN